MYLNEFLRPCILNVSLAGKIVENSQWKMSINKS